MDTLLEVIAMWIEGEGSSGCRDRSKKLRDVEILRNTISYQYGKEAVVCIDELLEQGLRLRYSSTGRVREGIVNGRTAFTVRVNDFAIIPYEPLARCLHRVFPYPRWRIVVVDEMVPDVVRGRTVFCKHVIDVDPEIKPFDEVLIVSENDVLIGVGRTYLGAEHILTATYGPAATLRVRILNA